MATTVTRRPTPQEAPMLVVHLNPLTARLFRLHRLSGGRAALSGAFGTLRCRLHDEQPVRFRLYRRRVARVRFAGGRTFKGTASPRVMFRAARPSGWPAT